MRTIASSTLPTEWSGGQVCCMIYNRRSLYAFQGKLVYGCAMGKMLSGVFMVE